ncbi:MAG: CPBP family intramembrane metalloprotease [Prevotellaceae bacterium]|jgi:membrane protease YdiL (CAAX protease family)|nr:CPBP family intramembrane metalloprotease [Prevotellaceae bacterium]
MKQTEKISENKNCTMKNYLQFIIPVCLVSWAVAGVAIWLGMRTTLGLAYTVFGSAYMLIPAVCAIVLQKIHKKQIVQPLKISFKFNRWFLAAILTPIAVSLLALGINLLFTDVRFSATYEGLLSRLPAEQAEPLQQQLLKFPPFIFFLIQLVSAVIAGCTINAFFALGEELGWRGYLLMALSGKRFWAASLITGSIWGIWHFPLILLGHNYPQHPVTGVFMMTVWCILLTPVITYTVLKSKSVITAAIYHGTLNAIAGISILYLTGGNDLTNGATGFAGFIALAVITSGFMLYDRYVTKEKIFFSKIK